MSILSELPDGAGYYYGFFESDPRQINVRPSLANRMRGQWSAFVGDTLVGNTFATKSVAEAAAIGWVEDNPIREEDPGIQAHMATPFAENH